MKKQYHTELGFCHATLRLYPLLLVVGMLTAFLGYRLYFPFLHLSLGYFESFILLCSVCLLVQCFIDSVPFFAATISGLVMSTILTIEAVLFLLFLQYYPIWSLLFAVVAVGLAVGFYRLVKKTSHRRNVNPSVFRKACRQHAAVLTVAVLCVVFAVPAGIGAYTEYVSDDLSAEEWAVFLQLLSESNAETAQYNSQPGVGSVENQLSALSEWDSLSQKERERLLRTVAITEKEALGIGSDVELYVVTDKLKENTYGNYNDKTKTITISYEYLHEASAEEMLETILHEMHHAYVHDVVYSLDFTSEEVQNGYYYKRAREWKENIENYHFASDDYYSYRAQPIEADARAYAEERVQMYLDIIEKTDAATTVG
ncbi:MAG: hypothetical protein IJC45_06950 [Clostridia bacterium]|nr:hypothetical protein [Clostridia bacterium]